MKKFLAFFLLVIGVFSLTGCPPDACFYPAPPLPAATSADGGTPVVTVSVSMKTIQVTPKKAAPREFGFQIAAPRDAQIISSTNGHLITKNGVHVHLDQLLNTDLVENGLSADPRDPAYPQMGLNPIDNGFFSWVPLGNRIYRFTCLGKVDKQTCQAMLFSLQIISQ